MNIYVTLGGYVAAAVLFWLLLETKEELGAEISHCNTQKALAVAEAERITREALQTAMDERIAQLEEILASERNARAIAEAAKEEAESRLPEVREVIREVASEDACIDTTVPDAVLDSLR